MLVLAGKCMAASPTRPTPRNTSILLPVAAHGPMETGGRSVKQTVDRRRSRSGGLNRRLNRAASGFPIIPQLPDGKLMICQVGYFADPAAGYWASATCDL